MGYGKWLDETETEERDANETQFAYVRLFYFRWEILKIQSKSFGVVLHCFVLHCCFGLHRMQPTIVYNDSVVRSKILQTGFF